MPGPVPAAGLDLARAALRGDGGPRARRIGEPMSKKRVHEIAKEQGLSSKELLEKLRAAGVDVKVAASSVEETVALESLGTDGSAGPPSPNGAPVAPATDSSDSAPPIAPTAGGAGAGRSETAV